MATYCTRLNKLFYKKLALFILIFFLTVFNMMNAVKFSFKEYPNGTFVVWHGCLFKTADWLVPSNNTKCSRCVQNGTAMAENSNKYFMRYRNCSLECRQPTLCTEYTFNFNGSWRSECFVCEAETHENVIYKAVPISELCGKECAACAAVADLATSTSCSQHCRGKPTFCPPHEPTFFGQKICYQSDKLHGCHFKLVDKEWLRELHGQSCVDCAKRVRRKEADICSHHCGNLPTWHRHITAKDVKEPEQLSKQATSVGTQKDEPMLLQCVLPKLGEALEYEIPQKIYRFLKNSSREQSKNPKQE